jgi:hypothetical protein
MGIKFEQKQRLERCKKEEIEFNYPSNLKAQMNYILILLH